MRKYILIILSFIFAISINLMITNNENVYINQIVNNDIPFVVEEIVFNGLTESELIDHINMSLNSTLEGKAYLIVPYALELGVDPYLATAIMLHETGCKWNCSTLMKECNNVGGVKGSPSCNGGSYKAYNTLQEGIEHFLRNLYYGYIDIGLITPELIGPKYAASTTWPAQVNAYIEDIKKM